MPLSLGTRLDSYEIVALIGAGGMGEVYRARDTSLKRDVAIKVLPTSYSLDPDRLRRFQLEAEAAATLNHPSILSIFHIGQQDGSPYIVTELLEGETLRARLRRSRMRLRESLDIAAEVTRGLAAAHEKGITHRDLKPENLFLTKDGRVKILDFGLAKFNPTQSTDADAATESLHEPTRPGQVLGTVGYMAPEQVRGHTADARSDIFAFGAVLYEMLTGKRAFCGESSADVFSAILNSDPPALSTDSREIPSAAARIVRRCLEKSPERRFQSAHDLGYALEAAAAASDSNAGEVIDNKRPRKRLLVKWLVAVFGLCAVIAALYVWLAPTIERELRLRRLQQLTAVPLTALPGNVESPTFSPDGSQIAFAWDGENNGAGYDLYVKAIGTERPLRLTHHPAPRLSGAWSPDGRSIAISRVAGEDYTGVYLLPPTGGPERKLIASQQPASGWGNDIGWSPDGRYLAYLDQPENAKSSISVWLYLLRLDTSERTPVKTGCDTVFTPSFSARGEYLAWVCRDTQAIFSVNAQRLSDGRILHPAHIEDDITGMAWSGDGRILFSASSGNLWETSLARPHDAKKLPFGHDARDIAVSPAAHRLVYVQGVTNINIWRLDLQASPPKASKLIVSSREQTSPSISPDGSKIAFESTRTGASEIWVCDADGSNAIQLSSFGKGVTGSPRWSPDGKWIAFDSRATGEANIYLVDPQGGVPRKLELDTHGNNMPSWSHDGKWIYFNNGDDAANQSVWKAPSSGGHATQLARNPAGFPIESTDGRYVYFFRNKRVWRINTDGSGEEAVKGIPESGYVGEQWFPVGSGIYFMSHSGGKDAIEFFDFSSQKVSRVYELEKHAPGWIGAMPVTSGGKYMLFPQVDEQSSNLMMIENWH